MRKLTSGSGSPARAEDEEALLELAPRRGVADRVLGQNGGEDTRPPAAGRAAGPRARAGRSLPISAWSQARSVTRRPLTSARSISVRASVVQGMPRSSVRSADPSVTERWTCSPGMRRRERPGSVSSIRPPPCGRSSCSAAAERWESAGMGPAGERGGHPQALAREQGPRRDRVDSPVDAMQVAPGSPLRTPESVSPSACSWCRPSTPCGARPAPRDLGVWRDTVSRNAPRVRKLHRHRLAYRAPGSVQSSRNCPSR